MNQWSEQNPQNLERKREALERNRSALAQQITEKSRLKELNHLLEKDGKLAWTLAFA